MFPETFAELAQMWLDTVLDNLIQAPFPMNGWAGWSF